MLAAPYALNDRRSPRINNELVLPGKIKNGGQKWKVFANQYDFVQAKYVS